MGGSRWTRVVCFVFDVRGEHAAVSRAARGSSASTSGALRAALKDRSRTHYQRHALQTRHQSVSKHSSSARLRVFANLLSLSVSKLDVCGGRGSVDLHAVY